MNGLWRRCQSEVQANRMKAILLAGLFLFGCCFWIPMLGRVLTPRHAAAATTSCEQSSDKQCEGQKLDDAESDPFWENLGNSLANDPLFQPAELSASLRDPFAVNEPQPSLLPPADEARSKIEEDHHIHIVGERPVGVEPVPAPTVPKEIEAPAAAERPRLTSTMVSPTRRAAMINGQFVIVDHEFQMKGQRYRLTHVESHRVVVTTGDETIELTINRPQLKDVLDRRNGDVPGQ